MKTSIFKSTAFFIFFFASFVGSAWAQSTNADSDPIADLADLYAFVDPPCTSVAGSGCENPPEELIVALTLNRDADGGDQFSPDVVYHFYFEASNGGTSQISCMFNDKQAVSCAGTGGMNGLAAEANIGQTGVNGDLRVYAGMRDDPFSFDVEAFEAFMTIGIAAYDGSGVDSLAGLNVLAIVIGIKVTAIPGGDANHNVQKIWAASERIGGDGINGAISGSWYNPEQDGQGWALEVVSIPGSPRVMLSYFYGHDNNGEQLWLLGSGADIDGTTATVDVFRQEGTGFGGEFDPTSTTRPVVGTMKFEFDTCDSGTATFTSDDPDLASFSSPITRLTNIASLNCNLLTAGQVDRVGRPFAAGLMPEFLRNDYNTNSNPDSWHDDYRETMLSSFQDLALADGNPAWNGFYSAEQWADIFADDRLQVDAKKAQSVDWLSIELSQLVPQDWEDSGGRALDYDVHEGFFNVMITSFEPFIDDGVEGNDLPFLDEFPFLADPH